MKSLTAILALAATPALANIEASFIESAPKDTFRFTNTSACDLGPATLTLDLSGSAAGLVFDTSADGAGVEVFQPYSTVSGAEMLASVTQVSDGDTQITLTLTGLKPDATVAFTIDVDDTLRNSERGQIQVSNSEIAGATIALRMGAAQGDGIFDETSRAVIQTANCTS